MYKYIITLTDMSEVTFESSHSTVSLAYLDYCTDNCIPKRIYDYIQTEIGKVRVVKSIHEDIF